MSVKVAAICMCNEKAWEGEKLTYFYALPGMSAEEVERIAGWYVDKTVRLIEKAASSGAKMACLPEISIEISRWLSSVERGPRMEMARKCWDLALETWCKAAARCGIVLVGGAIEPKGSKLYNSAPVIDERGNLLGCYHKVNLAQGEEKNVAYGDGFPVFKTKYGKVGVFICWDILFPEAVQSLAYNRADILFQPTYGHSGPMADAMAQIRAFDACCPLVIAMWNGRGIIIERDGTMLARGERTRDWQGIIPDQILYADVDPLAKRKWIGYTDFKKSIFAERRWQSYTPPGRKAGRKKARG
jgi:predicted amidohydrolase